MPVLSDWKQRGIVVKIGGEAASDYRLLEGLACEIDGLRTGHPCLLVHGGGKEVTELMRQVGMEPTFSDGIRMTSPEEMLYVDKVLSGKVNKRLVRMFQFLGLNAVGLSGVDGRTFIGRSLSEESRTGKVTAVNPRLLNLLIDEGFFPILCSTSMDKYGESLNINADEVAFELAGSLPCRSLVFLSDIPGVLKNGGVLSVLGADEALKEIETGTISGGMIPKVKASVDALSRGVSQIAIGTYKKQGDLRRLLEGTSGTRITASAEKNERIEMEEKS